VLISSYYLIIVENSNNNSKAHVLELMSGVVVIVR